MLFAAKTVSERQTDRDRESSKYQQPQIAKQKRSPNMPMIAMIVVGVVVGLTVCVEEDVCGLEVTVHDLLRSGCVAMLKYGKQREARSGMGQYVSSDEEGRKATSTLSHNRKVFQRVLRYFVRAHTCKASSTWRKIFRIKDS